MRILFLFMIKPTALGLNIFFDYHSKCTLNGTTDADVTRVGTDLNLQQ